MSDNASIQGQQWSFGISSADAPTIAGMIVTSADIKTESVVNAKAQSGQGLTIARALIGKKYTGTFSGYVSGTTPMTGGAYTPPSKPTGGLPLSTTFAPFGSAALFIKSGTYTFTKGQFATMSVEIEGYDSIVNSGGSGSGSGQTTGFAYGVPTGAPGDMITNTYTFKEEGELFVVADQSDGTPGAIAMAPNTKRILTETFTGYISSAFNSKPGDSYGSGVIIDVSDKRTKGEFVEVTVIVETIQTLAA